MPYLGARPTDVFADRDLNGQELILDVDGDTSITADSDDQIDIRLAGADDFQFTANIFKAQSSSQIQADDGSEASPGIIFSGDTGVGFWRAAAAEGGGQNLVGITTDNASGDGFGTVILERSRLHVNDDTVNATQASGLTIQQHGYDDQAISLKSSDIAVTTTFGSEADTYGCIKKGNATLGGIRIEGFSEGAIGHYPIAWTAVQPATSPATSVTDVPYLYAAAIYESSDYAYSANAVIWGLRKTISGGNWRSIAFFDEDGDLLLDGSSSNTAFDEEDDALLCRSFDLLRNPKQVIRSEFDRWTGDHKTTLEAAGILTKIDPDNPQHRNEDGTLGDPMVNVTQLQRLHNGAIWQQRAMFETMKQVADEMLPGFGAKLNERLAEQKLPVLPA